MDSFPCIWLNRNLWKAKGENGRQHPSRIELFGNHQCAHEKVDIPSRCFPLPESEYRAWSPAHVSAGATTAPDGSRMSINVEVIGGSLMVQHYLEEIGEPDHLRPVSNSDVFTPTGPNENRRDLGLSVKKIDDSTYEFTNMVHSMATPELWDFLAKQGIPWEVFRTARKPMSEAHNRQETSLFAKSIERHALNGKYRGEDFRERRG